MSVIITQMPFQGREYDDLQMFLTCVWARYVLEEGRKSLALINSVFSTDEKERFDPSQFQESIIQGLNQTGTDLEAVAKFLDASGAKLDYRRYAETLFDILVAGGMLGKRRGSSYVFYLYVKGVI